MLTWSFGTFLTARTWLAVPNSVRATVSLKEVPVLGYVGPWKFCRPCVLNTIISCANMPEIKPCTFADDRMPQETVATPPKEVLLDREDRVLRVTRTSLSEATVHADQLKRDNSLVKHLSRLLTSLSASLYAN